MNSQPLLPGKKSMNTSLDNTTFFECLNLRSDWEELVRNFKFDDPDRNHGTINNLEWFIENGHRSNSLRKRWGDAHELAVQILDKVG
jgi:hypothetical protein